MVETISPLEAYRSVLAEQHATLVRDHFDDLLKTSGVDQSENERLITELRTFEASFAASSSERTRWKVARFFAIVGAVGLAIAAFVNGGLYLLALLGTVGLVVATIKMLNPRIRKLNDTLTEVGAMRDAKLAETWEQMAPLNRLHTPDLAPRLFQETFPEVRLDRFQTAGGLADLHANFGLAPEFNDGRSVHFVQGGSIRENPFAFVRYVQHWMGTMTYYGSIVIFWIEEVQDDDGNWVEVQRSQTLTASVTKPYPQYVARTNLFYGHEAAPNLTFTRTPSSISGAEDGMLTNWRKDHALKKVERKAKRAVKSGDGQLTMMANQDFEVLFKALDRDHEVEFRLLFSPLAQQEMVDLLNDRTSGFGDNFILEKHERLNFVEAGHMGEIPFHVDPQIFASNELAQARQFFFNFHTSYFRGLYFSLAPLLTIPLYREKRSTAPADDVRTTTGVSAWECEAMANLIGEEHFKHPNSITQNIIRANPVQNADGSTHAHLTTFGYMGIPQVDIVVMLGGDGNVHEVPVEWTEYVPVTQESEMTAWTLLDQPFPPSSSPHPESSGEIDDALSKRGIGREHVVVRNGIAAAIA